MGEEQRAAYATQREAEREAAKAAAAQQRQRVADAMEHGLRVVVDCSLSLPLPVQQVASNGAAAPGGASDREVRSLCKQLELCAAANKRAIAPVSLRFASFTGRVRAFAEEGMHADRWPAARGHGEVLDQLFPSDQLVVLSPDAEEPLNTLEQGKASGRLSRAAGPRGIGQSPCFFMPLSFSPAELRAVQAADMCTASTPCLHPASGLA